MTASFEIMPSIQAHLTPSCKRPYTPLVKNAYMGPIGGRIAARLKELGEDVTVADVAKAAGVSRSAVYQWLSGDSKTLKASSLLAVAELLNVREKWLETGKGPKLKDADEQAGDITFVPVVGTAQLGDDGYWLELEYPTGSGEGFVPYPTRDPNTYALRVKGDSMRPRIKPGEFVVIEPNHATSPGDEVMVQTKDGRSMVKILGHRRGGIVELLSINEDTKPISVEETKITKMHYVGGIIKASLYYEKP